MFGDNYLGRLGVTIGVQAAVFLPEQELGDILLLHVGKGGGSVRHGTLCRVKDEYTLSLD